jgi:YD repeat-containing protein
MSTPFRFKNADNTTVDFEDYYVRADYFRSGNLWAWGANNNGQLGDNTEINRSSPVQTIACGSNWKQVFTRNYQYSGIKTDGTLWCWGKNAYGNLGDNTRTNRSSPVQTVAFRTNWVQVSSGYGLAAAIKTDGTLWTWGYNAYGQLGHNTILRKSSPVQTIAFGNNWKQVACGSQHCAAVKTDGTLWLWGYNANGALGDNTLTSRSSPVQTVASGTNWKQVACGDYYTAAIKTDGTLWAWGANYSGNLGDNTTVSKSSPVQTITGGTNWKQFSCGYGQIAAVKNDGTLWMWGSNSSGQLGDNTTVSKSSPVQTVAFGTSWKNVASGDGGVTLAIKTDGTLWSWGNNQTFGLLIDDTFNSKSSPVQTIAGGTNWKQATVGQFNCAAIQYQDDYQ